MLRQLVVNISKILNMELSEKRIKIVFSQKMNKSEFIICTYLLFIICTLLLILPSQCPSCFTLVLPYFYKSAYHIVYVKKTKLHMLF